jgi:hypothetical protein
MGLDFGGLGRDIGRGLRSVGDWTVQAGRDTAGYGGDLIGSFFGRGVAAATAPLNNNIMLLVFVVVGGLVVMKVVEKK